MGVKEGGGGGRGYGGNGGGRLEGETGQRKINKENYEKLYNQTTPRMPGNLDACWRSKGEGVGWRG